MPTTPRDDGPSLGEIGRLLETLRDEQRDFRGEVNRKFDQLDSTYLRVAIFDATMLARSQYVKGLEDRIASIEGNLAWGTRIIVGTVIMAVIGGLFAASKVVGA